MRTHYPRILVLSSLVTAFLFSATAQLPAQQVQAQRKSKLLFVTQCKGFRHAVLHQAEGLIVIAGRGGLAGIDLRAHGQDAAGRRSLAQAGG